MTDSEEFCQNLRLLSSYEPSIAALCRKLSFNRQQFNKYLAGSVFPSRRNLRRICDHFGVTDSEILMPHHTFSQLVSLKPRKDKAREASPEGDALHRLQANSRAVPDRYLGLYFLYSPSFAYRGLFTRSLVSIFRRDGVVYWKNIEVLRRRDRDEPAQAVSKYVGILCLVGDRLHVLQEEVIFQNVLSQTILYPSFTKQVRHLVGIHTSIADLNRRTPAASRVVLEYLGRTVDLRASLRQCGQFPAGSIPTSVLEELVSTNKHGDGIVEASAD
jgi:transcriptional regulator with XRE-family HTH domain